MEEINNELIGSGSALINPNSEEFKALRGKVLDHVSQISHQEKLSIQIQGLRYRMESYLDSESPEKEDSAGSFLRELVEITGVSHKVFAAYLELKNSNLSALYKGTRRINYDIAMKLGNIFNMDPALWISVQNKAELDEIRKTRQEQYAKFSLEGLLKFAG